MRAGLFFVCARPPHQPRARILPRESQRFREAVSHARAWPRIVARPEVFPRPAHIRPRCAEAVLDRCPAWRGDPAAGEGIGDMERRDGFERYGAQIPRGDREGLGERQQGMDRPDAAIVLGEPVAGDGFFQVEGPSAAVGLGLDPAFEARLSAEIDAALAIGVLSMGHDHGTWWGDDGPGRKTSWRRLGQSIGPARNRGEGVWRSGQGTWVALTPGAEASRMALSLRARQRGHARGPAEPAPSPGLTPGERLSVWTHGKSGGLPSTCCGGSAPAPPEFR